MLTRFSALNTILFQISAVKHLNLFCFLLQYHNANKLWQPVTLQWGGFSNQSLYLKSDLQSLSPSAGWQRLHQWLDIGAHVECLRGRDIFSLCVCFLLAELEDLLRWTNFLNPPVSSCINKPLLIIAVMLCLPHSKRNSGYSSGTSIELLVHNIGSIHAVYF